MFKYSIKCPTCNTEEKIISSPIELEKIICRICSKPIQMVLIKN